jgi:hypothetical protein
MSLYDVRRQRQSRSRSKRAAVSSAGRAISSAHAVARPPRVACSTLMHPGASAASSSKRAVALSSLGVEEPFGGTLPSASRAKSSRPSAELRLSHDPAHHTTAWCWARVRAT